MRIPGNVYHNLVAKPNNLGCKQTLHQIFWKILMVHSLFFYDIEVTYKQVIGFSLSQHKNQVVNEELWKEAQTYGDIQLMPFVDYYNIITWKTIAICTYGVNFLWHSRTVLV